MLYCVSPKRGGQTRIFYVNFTLNFEYIISSAFRDFNYGRYKSGSAIGFDSKTYTAMPTLISRNTIAVHFYSTNGSLNLIFIYFPPTATSKPTS